MRSTRAWGAGELGRWHGCGRSQVSLVSRTWTHPGALAPYLCLWARRHTRRVRAGLLFTSPTGAAGLVLLGSASPRALVTALSSVCPDAYRFPQRARQVHLPPLRVPYVRAHAAPWQPANKSLELTLVNVAQKHVFPYVARVVLFGAILTECSSARTFARNQAVLSH